MRLHFVALYSLTRLDNNLIGLVCRTVLFCVMLVTGIYALPFTTLVHCTGMPANIRIKNGTTLQWHPNYFSHYAPGLLVLLKGSFLLILFALHVNTCLYSAS